MSEILLAGTDQGMALCRKDAGEWQVTQHGLQDQAVTSLVARERVILAGTHQGIFRSDNLGQTWQEASRGLEIRHIRWLAYHPDISDFELAGAEPAGIFISHDGGDSWRECLEVSTLRRQHGWYLPYSPEAGCVRGFAIHGERAYAAVEVGGVLLSNNGGKSWELAQGSSGSPHSAPPKNIHPDVHSIVVHPSSPDLVYAPTGGGFYRSQDGGRTWQHLYECYCRAAWIDPADPHHIVLGPADFVDRLGRIEESQDGGRTWQPASTGMLTPWPRHMVERFYQLDDSLLAVLSNGELLSASLESLHWKRILPDLAAVNAVALLRS